MDFRYKILEDTIRYTGEELRSGWVREHTGLIGDAAAAFIGPCLVPTENLVDMDDARSGAHIESAMMAHIIIEHIKCPLQVAVLRQRLLASLLRELLNSAGLNAHRDGDDVYLEMRKLTVSIAAPSEVSSLIHMGINVDPQGAPVPAAGLEDAGIEARDLLGRLLDLYSRELADCSHAERKVRAVP
jgi:hypothetical protein